jgi:hypothetical protein
MTFGSSEQATATSNESLEQLKTVYNTNWLNTFNDNFKLIAILNMWYENSTVNDNPVNITVYYYFDLQNPNNQIYRDYFTATFTYDPVNAVYDYVPSNGRPASNDSNGLTSEELDGLTLFYTNPITENMTPEELDAYILSLLPIPSHHCFPAYTPVLTDQGLINISNINTQIHTIHNQRIVALTHTYNIEKSMIMIKKNAIVFGVPNIDTVITQNHKILYGGKFVEAFNLINHKSIYRIPYNGELLYNILLDNHTYMVINNLICETLDPNSLLAKLHKANLSIPDKNQITEKLNFACLIKT